MIRLALKFSEEVQAQGIAKLLEASDAPEEKLLWCTWKTDNFERLQAAFDQMNEESGLRSKLGEIEIFFPES